MFPSPKLNPGLVGESHKSLPLGQLGVFRYQSLTLIRLLVACSVALNRFQSNRRPCWFAESFTVPESNSGILGESQHPSLWIDWECSLFSILNSNAFVGCLFCCIGIDLKVMKVSPRLQRLPVQESNPGLVVESHKFWPLDQLGLCTL